MSCSMAHRCIEDTPCNDCYFDGYRDEDFADELERISLASEVMRLRLFTNKVED